MKEFKGTKGKWKATKNDYYWDISPIDDNQTFASTHKNVYLDIDEELVKVNAKLIASAPELLEALQFLYDDAESWSGLHGSTKDKIEQAINKALS